MLTKKCIGCQIEKPLDEFRESSRYRLGVMFRCKVCEKAFQKENYEKNRDKIRQRQAAYREQNREKIREQAAKWRDEHREEIRPYSLNYYHATRDKRLAEAARYRQNNPERDRQRRAKYNRENKDKKAKYNAEYARLNPDKGKAKTQKYRARKHETGGSFTEAEWKQLCNQYGNVCLCCGESKPLHADHVIPVSRGGTSNIDNIQPLCRFCNQSKGSQIIDYRPDNGYHIPKQLSLW